MEIKIRPFRGDESWVAKQHGVILVEKEAEIEPLWELLCNQDDHWKKYKHIIKVAPLEIDDISELQNMCEYAGKTDIYDPAELQKYIPFLMFQP